MTAYLPAGLPTPVAEADGLSAPYWDGLRAGVLRVQRCAACGTWQWGPEWICHACHAESGWVEVAPRGRVFSWERVWHPVHPVLRGATPYLVVLVALADAGGVRMVGNLLGPATQAVVVGAAVEGVFEQHGGERPFGLLQWRVVHD